MMQVALVTGGTRGIGRGIAQKLAEQGFHLLLGYRADEAAAQQARQELEQYNIKVVLVHGDMREPATVDAFAGAIETHFDGHLNAVVHNAGYTIVATLPGNFSFEQYEDAQEIYPRAFLRLVEMAIKYMPDGEGRIVAISSHGVHDPSDIYAMAAPAKTAMEVLAKHYALALAPRGITVNTISPGYIRTQAWDGYLEAMPYAEEAGRLATPMGRWGEPADVAPMVAFFCSSESRFVTGQHVYVDGGLKLALFRNSHMMASRQQPE
jgi:NAD(P)-dependent dehydrogenase (short-subunit alcohol dehydrogenase family)